MSINSNTWDAKHHTLCKEVTKWSYKCTGRTGTHTHTHTHTHTPGLWSCCLSLWRRWWRFSLSLLSVEGTIQAEHTPHRRHTHTLLQAPWLQHTHACVGLHPHKRHNDTEYKHNYLGRHLTQFDWGGMQGLPYQLEMSLLCNVTWTENHHWHNVISSW